MNKIQIYKKYIILNYFLNNKYFYKKIKYDKKNIILKLIFLI